jgi:two-component system, cell cycle sensor histidine kinase and response regulator CckA
MGCDVLPLAGSVALRVDWRERPASGGLGTLRDGDDPGTEMSTEKNAPPRTEEGRAEPPEAVPGPEVAPTRGTILVVDDEEGVRQVCRMMLSSLGFNVLVAATGDEAIDVFRRNDDEVRCIILDLTMPRTDGVTTFREIRKIRSDAKVILSSGFAEREVLRKFEGEGLSGFLQKPYRLKNLQEELARVRGRET